MNGERLHVGDRLLFLENSTKLGVENGTLGTLTKIDGRTIHVALDDGRKVSIPTIEYGSIRLGYALTTHKAQGGTTPNGFVMLESGMQDLHLTRVQASRAKRSTQYFLDKATAGKDFSEIIDQMSQSRLKEFATDKRESLADKSGLQRANAHENVRPETQQAQPMPK